MDIMALLTPEMLSAVGSLSPYAVLVLIIILLIWMVQKKEKRIDQLMSVNNELISLQSDNLKIQADLEVKINKTISRLERITDFIQFKKLDKDE